MEASYRLERERPNQGWELAKEVLLECGKGAVTTALGFGAGCLAGHIVDGPVLITGGVYAVSACASWALGCLTKKLAEKFDWNLSTVKITQALTAALITVATSVTLFAMGIFGPISLGVTLGVGLTLGVALPLAMGLYAKFGGKDLPYKEAVKIAKIDPKRLERSNEEEELSQVQDNGEEFPPQKKLTPGDVYFYKYAL